MADRRIDQLTEAESVNNDDLFVIWKNNISQTRSLKMQSLIPVGAIMPFYGSIAPDGWFICDGTDTTNTSNQLDLYHPELYSVLGNSNILPDLRECVLVGAGQSTRAILDETGHSHDVYTLGEFKDDQIQNITGRMETDAGSKNGGTGPFRWLDNDKGAPSKDSSYWRQGEYTFDLSRSARTGNVTHGKQVGVNYIIKCQPFDVKISTSCSVLIHPFTASNNINWSRKYIHIYNSTINHKIRTGCLPS